LSYIHGINYVYILNFSDKIIEFYHSLPSDLPLPEGVSLIYPFGDGEVRKTLEAFYTKYFSDSNYRYYLFGINPGRFGAGITGIPFTDPKILEDYCGIRNNWDKKNELSSLFVYDFIEGLGGPKSFYKNFIISSVCPLGFIKDGKNYNYYDDLDLERSVEPFILESIEKQLNIYCRRDKAFSLGKGKNYKYLKQLNDQHKWFDEIIALPHPRWVMQYQRKNYNKHLDDILNLLSGKA